MRIRPTFITFNPWVSADDLIVLDNFLKETGISDMFDDMQRTTRLLLYKGSPLLSSPSVQKLSKVDKGSYYEWSHDQSEMDTTYHALNMKNSCMTRKRCCIKG